MGQLSGKQLAASLGAVFLLLLIALGTSRTGQRLAMAATQPFAEAWNFLRTQAQTLTADEDRLEQKIRQLEGQLRTLEQSQRENQTLRRENEQLRQTLALGPFPAWHLMRADVIVRDPMAWDLQFTINRGEAEGIIVGAPVLFQQWMIGRVATVNQHSAVIHTIVSPQCRIGVTLQDTNFHGLLKGMGRMHRNAPGCVIDYLPLETSAELNDTLVTSGLGGAIPEGIPVATVSPDAQGNSIHDVEHARKQLFAKPLAQWDDMRVVSILLPN